MKVIRKYGHFIIVPIYLVFYLLVFQHVESRSGAQVHILHTRLDDMIPFCEYFIIPSVLWFGYVAAAVIYFGLIGKSRQEYFRLIASLGIGMTLFLAISLVWPNGHALRPYHFEHENIFVDMVRALYRIDTPTNIFPSIHVFNSIAVAVAAADSEALKKHTWVVRGSNVLALLIVCATVFLKQHTVLDVISAVCLNLLCVRFIYRPGYAIGRRSVTERVEVLK